MSEVTKKNFGLTASQWRQLSGEKNLLILFCGRFACSVISDNVLYWEIIVLPLLCCHFEFKHKEHKFCISGRTKGKAGARSRNGGGIPAIPYVPLSVMWFLCLICGQVCTCGQCKYKEKAVYKAKTDRQPWYRGALPCGLIMAAVAQALNATGMYSQLIPSVQGQLYTVVLLCIAH